MRNLIGCTLGHDRIVEKIGAGGMGQVYRTRDERLDREGSYRYQMGSPAPRGFFMELPRRNRSSCCQSYRISQFQSNE